MTGRATLLSLSVLASCSTLAPLPEAQECTNDNDCDRDKGEICAPETNICVPGDTLPPRAHLGFDIQEFANASPVFRTEVAGCDELVKLNPANAKLEIRRNWQQERLELEVFVADVEENKAPTPADLLPAMSVLSLSQLQRFGYRANQPLTTSYPSFEDEMMMILSPTIARLARYALSTELPPTMGDGNFVLWQVQPNAADVERAPLHRMLAVPRTTALPDGTRCTEDAQCCVDGDCEKDRVNSCVLPLGECTGIGNPRFAYRFKYSDDCSRSVRAGVSVVYQDGSIAELPDASVRIQHADGETPLGVFALDDTPIADRDDECSANAECIPGEQFCETVTSQCQLALAGRDANSARTTDEIGGFEASVYTYCDEPESGCACNGAVNRNFTFTVRTANGAQPTVQYAVEVPFTPIGGTKPVATILPRLCVPDWGPPITAELGLSGAAVDLVGSGPTAYNCCDVSCLPASPDDAAMVTTPPYAETCSGATSGASFPHARLEAEATFTFTPQEWEALDCMLPIIADGGRIGSLSRDFDCSGAGEASCVVPNLGAGPNGQGRQYQLRLESPVGSVLGSIETPLVIEGASGDVFVQSIDLPARVLVRGIVRVDPALCDPVTAEETDCGSERALVLAERLRMPGEDPATEVGPFFHEVQTFYDPIALRPGAYVLPLDPGGVYLLTALPAAGSIGGPAPIEILDLRDATEDQKLDFVLREGVLVTVAAIDFDRRAQFTPIDRGSWAGRIDHPGRPGTTIDLNVIGECLTPPAEGALACKIRRLIPGASLTASQVGDVRFTARAATEAAASCSSG